jgi:hypothetical protein
MAYSMYLKGAGFNHKAWQQEIQTTYIDNPMSVATPLSALCHQTSDLDEGVDREDLWLHPAGGIRGVTVRQSNGEVELSLPLGSSLTDFGLAWELMRMGVRHGASPSDEERDHLTMADDEIRQITHTQSKFYWSMLTQQLDGQLTLPVGGFLGLPVTRADASDGHETLERKLVERMNRYSEAFVATLMRMTKDGESSLFSNYAHIPSLINAEVEYIGTHGDGGNICDEPVPAGHFYSVVGERAEKLGDWIYVPAIDFASEPELVAALNSFRSEKSSIPKPTLPSENGLTGEDWAKLAKAPCLVFLLVAAADGGIDKKEVAAFGSILQRHAAIPSPIFSRILQITQANFESFITEIASGETPVAQHLMEIGWLLQSGRLPKEEAITVGKHLCALGEMIASSSGGFLGFGPKISKKEAEVLKFLEALLVTK